MKIKPDHYQHLKSLIETVKDKIPSHREALKSDPRVKDLEMRLRWDALWATNKQNSTSAWMCANLYQYMNDDHIDTALRSIMKELNLCT